ncbi:hypothetical protein [Mycetocola saprophilus]|uniref:hypothetical protein n=1 Tax=Mycetocola saprophilus TaxID=76636 RepID=UPI003BF14A2F
MFGEEGWASIAFLSQLANVRTFEQFGWSALIKGGLWCVANALLIIVSRADFNRVSNNIDQIAGNVNAEQMTLLDEIEVTYAMVHEIRAFIQNARRQAGCDEQ